MSRFTTLVCCSVGLVTASPEGDRRKFGEFIHNFGKKYDSVEEELRRFEVFTKNLEDIAKLQAVEGGSATYSHLTPFADLSSEEFSSRLGLLPVGQDLADAPRAETLNVTALPDSLDWRTLGAVNQVKNQQSCGSCWAFATVANIEGAGFVTNKKLLSLSEQELVDCDKATGDVGCGGGLPSNAYKDMIKNKIGLETESAYPYVARDDKCKAQASSEVAFISGYLAISTDEVQIAASLQKYGPLAIGINAGPMQLYFGGVAHPWKIFCNPKKLDHGVAIVGFGVDGGKKYWTIRNSWGPSWGEKGYYRIVRGAGACGLNTMVTTATGITFKSSVDLVV